ncbi:MAG: hypothetical protein QXJ28_02450 [Candidatus Pacearchaeota archaeon]
MKTRKLSPFIEEYPSYSLKSNNNSYYFALSLDKSSINKKTKLGVAREVFYRRGKPWKKGFLDKSKLIIVSSNDLIYWKKECDLEINGITQLIKEYSDLNREFIGLEDPDIINYEKNKYLYFTLAYKKRKLDGFFLYLCCASGPRLNALSFPRVVLSPNSKFDGFKESCIDIKNKIAFNETILKERNTSVSCISLSQISLKLINGINQRLF